MIPFEKLLKFCNLYNYSLDYGIGLIRRNIKYNKNRTNKTKIGKILKEIIKELNLTQTKLSEQCSISQSTYNAYESGKYLINTLTIYTTYTKYNISMDYIVDRTNKKYIK